MNAYAYIIEESKNSCIVEIITENGEIMACLEVRNLPVFKTHLPKFAPKHNLIWLDHHLKAPEFQQAWDVYKMRYGEIFVN